MTYSRINFNVGISSCNIFHTFCQNTVASAMGVPFPPLSNLSFAINQDTKRIISKCQKITPSADTTKIPQINTQRDQNYNHRQWVLMVAFRKVLPDGMRDTEKRTVLTENTRIWACPKIFPWNQQIPWSMRFKFV